MAISHLHAAPDSGNSRPGPITAGLLKWESNGADSPRPFGASNGPEAAGDILINANALTLCLSASFMDSHQGECEFAAVPDSIKALALDAIGNLIMLAKVMTDED